MRATLSVVAVVLFFAAPARAEDELMQLRWAAPLGCPTAAEVKAAVMRSVDPRTALPGVLEADARVEEAPGRWRVLLTTKRGEITGERAIEAPTCTGVADATAVVLALALAPPGNAPVEPPPPPPPPPPSPPVREPPDHLFAAGVSAAFDGGTLPKLAVGGAAHVAFTPGRWRVEGAARIFPEQTEHAGATPAGARFSLFGASGRLCGAIVRQRRFDVSPCIGAELEVMRANGLGAETNFQPTKTWMDLDLGAIARVRATDWLAVRLGVDAEMPLYRPNFVVENVGAVYKPSAVGVAGTLGAEVLFF